MGRKISAFEILFCFSAELCVNFLGQIIQLRLSQLLKEFPVVKTLNIKWNHRPGPNFNEFKTEFSELDQFKSRWNTNTLKSVLFNFSQMKLNDTVWIKEICCNSDSKHIGLAVTKLQIFPKDEIYNVVTTHRHLTELVTTNLSALEEIQISSRVVHMENCQNIIQLLFKKQKNTLNTIKICDFAQGAVILDLKNFLSKTANTLESHLNTLIIDGYPSTPLRDVILYDHR